MVNLLERAIDRVVLVVSPERAVRRIGARNLYGQIQSQTRRYEGASRGRRTKNWRTPATDANAALATDIKTLRNRSRDLCRNNTWAGRAVRSIAAYTVGKGIRPNVVGPRGPARKIEKAFRLWAKKTSCSLDGSSSFWGLQNQVMRGVVESGAALVRRVRTTDTKIPLALQVLEPDHLDMSILEAKNGNPVLHGIEFDKDTQRRVAYHVFKDHPGSTAPLRQHWESERVPASEILHIFRVDRPGQIQGAPWGATTIILLRNFDEYQDAQVVRQLLGACFSGIVKGSAGGDIGNPALGMPGGKAPLQELEPGAILHLAAGEDIVFSKPPEVEGYAEFGTQTLRAVSAGFDVPYQVLAQDLSNVNFSSGRMGANDYQLHIENWREIMIIPQMLDPLWDWWLEAAVAGGELPVTALETEVHWTAPAHVQVNPTEEAKADTESIRAGLKTLPQCLRERGRELDEVLEETAESNKLLDEYGIVLASDPRHFGAPGAAATPQPEPTGADESKLK